MKIEFGDTKEKILFTPGPLTTSRKVKEAMLFDCGSRDHYLADVIAFIRSRLLMIGGCSVKDYASILLSGSGTYGVESVLSSIIGDNDHLLILDNGAYGRRLDQIAKAHKLPHQTMTFPEDQIPDAELVRKCLSQDRFTHIAMIHCETTTGILNPIEAIGDIAEKHGASLIVDAMSSFGGIPIKIPNIPIDFLISSSNKCIEGAPGFSFIIAKRSSLFCAEGKARTLGLDLLAQYRGLEQDGLFRFTPPTHVLLAFKAALELFEQEGGVDARAARYQKNHAVLLTKMSSMGFSCYLEPNRQSFIITSFRFPREPRFDFDDFYQRLSEYGYLIYPGKVSDADCFRIGTIGHIFPHDVENLMSAIERALDAMSIALPLS